mgnify:CR=1 FL=1
MESEASHRSSVSVSAPASVYSRVLDISVKSHNRYISNTYAAIEETRSLCQFINTQGEGNADAISLSIALPLIQHGAFH